MPALQRNLTLLALLLAAGAAFLSSPALAGIRKCDIPSLGPEDARQARAAASRASKGKLKEFDVSNACRYRGGANVVATTPHILNAEGAEEWWFLFCSRIRGHWDCEAPHPQRSAQTRITIEGIERNVSITYDPGVSSAAMRTLVQHAFAQYYDPATDSAMCAGGFMLPLDQPGWEKARSENRHAADELEIYVSGYVFSGGVRLLLIRNVAIEFSSEEVSAAEDAKGCWGELVIVD
jgi:hypothetical protein